MKHIWWKTVAERIEEAGWKFEPVFKSKKELLKVQQKINAYYAYLTYISCKLLSIPETKLVGFKYHF